jgi:UDP-N-acetylmuramoyl-tripeptide--D-alanyl-D-alanine ligase
LARPSVETAITQHTLWQAITGETPPLALPAAPVGIAVIDSRDVAPGALFIAFAGQQTDGHRYIGDALAAGAGTIICEEQGLTLLNQTDALVVNCTSRSRSVPTLETYPRNDVLAQRPIAYVVDRSVEALQKVGAFHRLHRVRPDLRVIGITGSVGKTSTKETAAAVLDQRFNTHRNQGNLNSEQGLPLTLLGLTMDHQRAVLEMGMYALGEIALLCKLARPHVGVITNVGPVHLERLGTIERIAQAKAELVEALPSAEEGGVAILNWDDERVREMASATRAQIFTYGLTPEAQLWADEIESAGLEGIRFRFHHQPPQGRMTSLYVKVPLLGRHSVHTALRAAAIGLVEGLTWQEIATGLQRTTGQLRLVVVPGINGSTLIDDTYNASPTSTLAALNLLADLQNSNYRRRIAVLGDMRELGSYTEEGHKAVGIRAAAVTEVLVTVGELGRIIGEEALAMGFDPANCHIMATAEEAVERLKSLIEPGDLVLIKGSRAVGMEQIAADISLHESRNTPKETH